MLLTKKSYEVSTHKRLDVIEDRKAYCYEALWMEINSPCWIQFPLLKITKMVDKNEETCSKHFEKREDGKIHCRCGWCTFYQYMGHDDKK